MKTRNLIGIFYKKNQITSDLIEYYYHYRNEVLQLIEIENNEYEYFLGKGITANTLDLKNINIDNYTSKPIDNSIKEIIQNYLLKSDFPEESIRNIDIFINEISDE